MVHNAEFEAIIDAPLDFEVNYHSGDSAEDRLIIDMNNHTLDEVIQMYATRQQGRNNSRTPVNPEAKLDISTYRKLSPEGQRVWRENMPEKDRIVIARGQKDAPSSADNSLHPSPGSYRSPSRTSSNQHSVMFADNDGNEDRGTADLELNHARFDTPPRVADSTTSFMSAIRRPFTTEEIQGCTSDKP